MLLCFHICRVAVTRVNSNGMSRSGGRDIVGDALKTDMKRTGLWALREVAAVAAVSAALLTAQPALALSLGRLSVQSSLGESLRAEIDVTSLTPEEAANLRVRVAPPDSYRVAGIDYNPVLPVTQVVLERRPDGTAFLRISNSYNRTRLLRFELGFCRWICLNGIIFGSKSIEFSYAHTRRGMDRVDRFVENIGDIRKLETAMTEKLHQLKRYHVPEKEMLPLLCRAFDIKATKEVLEKPRRVEDLVAVREQAKALTKSPSSNGSSRSATRSTSWSHCWKSTPIKWIPKSPPLPQA